jgi:hypothetical protein
MINEQALQRLYELADLYKKRWGKEVDLTIITPRCSQETMVLVLERIVDTGESVLVGWNYIVDKEKSKE